MRYMTVYLAYEKTFVVQCSIEISLYMQIMKILINKINIDEKDEYYLEKEILLKLAIV